MSVIRPGLARTPSLWLPGQAPLGSSAEFDRTHPQSRGLLGWWTSALGDFASDITGQRAKLTQTGAPTTGASRLGPTKTLASGQYWSGTDAGLPAGDTPRTVSIWASTTSTSGPLLWAYGTVGGDAPLFMYLSSNTFVNASTSLHALTNSSTTAFNDGKLHHYVLSYSGGGITKLLIDGLDYTSYGGSYNTNTLVTSLGPGLFIGSYYGSSNYWVGALDNFKIWDRALSTQEMLAEYYEPFGQLRPVAGRRRVGVTGSIFSASITDGSASGADVVTSYAAFASSISNGSASGSEALVHNAIFIGTPSEGSASGADGLVQHIVFIAAPSEGSAFGLDSQAQSAVLIAAPSEGSASASDSQTTPAVFPATPSETTTTTDTQSIVLQIPAAPSETTTAADAQSIGLQIPASASETGSASDATASPLIYRSATTETGSASESNGNGALFAATLGESQIATAAAIDNVIQFLTLNELSSISDTQSQSMLMLASVPETVAVLDDVTALSPGGELIAENGAAIDLIVDHLLMLAAIGESGSAVDTRTQSLAIPATIGESGTASDAISPTLRILAAIGESGSASTLTADALVIALAATETSSAADTPAFGLTIPIAINESVSTADSHGEIMRYVELLSETGTVISVAASGAMQALSVSEAMNASETLLLSGLAVPAFALSLDASLLPHAHDLALLWKPSPVVTIRLKR